MKTFEEIKNQLREGYNGYEDKENLSFVEWIDRESENDPDFFRWFYGDDNLPDFAAPRNLSDERYEQWNDFCKYVEDCKTTEILSNLISNENGTLRQHLEQLMNRGWVHPTYDDPYFHKINSNADIIINMLKKANVDFFVYNESKHLVRNGKIIILPSSYYSNISEEDKEICEKLVAHNTAVLYSFEK